MQKVHLTLYLRKFKGRRQTDEWTERSRSGSEAWNTYKLQRQLRAPTGWLSGERVELMTCWL